jgi:hypothetical protein
MNREEHLEWCKKRALEYVEMGDLQQAVTSMLSDLEKHKETINHPAKELGVMMLFSGGLKTTTQVEKFINGFH